MVEDASCQHQNDHCGFDTNLIISSGNAHNLECGSCWHRRGRCSLASTPVQTCMSLQQPFFISLGSRLYTWLYLVKSYELLFAFMHFYKLWFTSVNSTLISLCFLFRMTDMHGPMKQVDASGDSFSLVMCSRSAVIPGCGVLTAQGGIAGYGENRRLSRRRIPPTKWGSPLKEELLVGRKRGGPWVK